MIRVIPPVADRCPAQSADGKARDAPPTSAKGGVWASLDPGRVCGYTRARQFEMSQAVYRGLTA